MKDIWRNIRVYSESARREEKTRRRRRDLLLAEAGQSEQIQSASRLIANPREWRLEPSEPAFLKDAL